MKIHLQYITEKTNAKGKYELANKAESLKKNKKLEVEVGTIRKVPLSDKEVLVIDIWLLPNGMYTGDTMRIVKNFGEPYAYFFE